MELGSQFQTIGRGTATIATPGAGFTQVARGLSGAVGRTGAGVYTMPLLTPVPPANAKVTASVISGAAGGNIIVVPDGTGTTWTISTLNQAGVATDLAWSVTIEQIV